MSTLSISIHFIANAEQDKEGSGSSPEVLRDDTRFVSDDYYTKGWGKRRLFVDQSQLVSAMREYVMNMNCTKRKQ